MWIFSPLRASVRSLYAESDHKGVARRQKDSPTNVRSDKVVATPSYLDRFTLSHLYDPLNSPKGNGLELSNENGGQKGGVSRLHVLIG